MKTKMIETKMYENEHALVAGSTVRAALKENKSPFQCCQQHRGMNI